MQNTISEPGAYLKLMIISASYYDKAENAAFAGIRILIDSWNIEMWK